MQCINENIIVYSGGFLGGLVIPRDGGLAISLTEKLEDVVSIVFLPLVSSFTCLLLQNLPAPYFSVLRAVWFIH